MDHVLILMEVSMLGDDIKKYERNNVDRFISSFNCLKYSIVEPACLRIERSKALKQTKRKKFTINQFAYQHIIEQKY